MKRYQFYILLSLIFFAASCKKEQGVKFYDLGSEFFISSPGYTNLDTQAVLSINNLNKNLSEVKVTNLGGILADDSDFTSTYTGKISIGSDGTGSITLTSADIGTDGIGASAKFQFDATIDGKPFSRFYTLNEEDPISLTVPENVMHVPASDTTYYLYFNIAPVSATVTGVKVQTKIGVNSTYTDVSATFNATDSLAIVGADYNVGDSLYINIIGTAGTKTTNSETTIVINPGSYEHLSTFKLDSTANMAYDFVGDSAVSVDSTEADIRLAVTEFTGGFDLGFASPNNTMFVSGTALDYTYADILNIQATDFSAGVTSVDKVSVGDVYIFKTMRGTKTYYGVMKVTAVEKPQGVVDDSYVQISYKY